MKFEKFPHLPLSLVAGLAILTSAQTSLGSASLPAPVLGPVKSGKALLKSSSLQSVELNILPARTGYTGVDYQGYPSASLGDVIAKAHRILPPNQSSSADSTQCLLNVYAVQLRPLTDLPGPDGAEETSEDLVLTTPLTRLGVNVSTSPQQDKITTFTFGISADSLQRLLPDRLKRL